MKKIVIITWITWNNYGTYLQAYALQQALQAMGYDCKILDDACYIPSKGDWRSWMKNILKSVHPKYASFYHSQRKMRKGFAEFKKNFIYLEKRTSDVDFLEKTYDVFVCGSDQIWNPYSLMNSNWDFYFATFTDKIKIAYAPSLGVSAIPNSFINQFSKSICNFNFLSAREEDGKKIMYKLTGKHVEKVVDPTLLLSRSEYSQMIACLPPQRRDYLLAYFLTPNPAFIHAARIYAFNHQLKFKLFFTDQSYRGLADELIAGGPLDFMRAIRDAKYVFTDSFHGTIFAYIFECQFVTFLRFGKDDPNSQNSRVENLLNMMGLSDRLIDKGSISSIDTLQEIKFTKVQESLAPYIEPSKQYLVHALQTIGE